MVIFDRTKGCCSIDLNEPPHSHHDQFAELDAHNSGQADKQSFDRAALWAIGFQVRDTNIINDLGFRIYRSSVIAGRNIRHRNPEFGMRRGVATIRLCVGCGRGSRARLRRRSTGPRTRGAECVAVATADERPTDRLRIEELRFARDSPLEEAGFEPSVPRRGQSRIATSSRAA
jgi:hypothetical protein